MRILSNVNILGTLDLDNVQNAAADTDRFLVQDANGVVKFRTGAEVASDIGASVGFVSTVKHEVKLGEAIAKGQAVYVTSSDGTNMIVSKASNATDSTSSKTFGLLETGGAANAKVFVITEGLLAGLDTSLAATGDPVWLGTAGNLLYGVANKPVAPAHMVFIGIVTRVNANNGEIFVKVQNGFELEELHNVLITGTPVDKAVIQYDTASGLWKNSALSGVTGSGTTNYLPKFTGASTLGNSLVFDNGSAVGIGIATPSASYRLTLNGDSSVNTGGIVIRQSGTDVMYIGNIAGANTTDFEFWNPRNGYLRFATNNTERARFTAGGNLLVGSTSDNGLRFQVTGDGSFSGTLTTGSPFTIQAAAPYIQWKNVAGTRLGYIQHNATDLVINADTGNINLFTSGGSLYFNTSGNLGLGVVPSAWFVSANIKAFEIGYKGNAIYGVGASDIRIIANAYYDGAYKYADTVPASVYQQNDGVHKWFTAPSGTINTAITFTTAMTLDASGRLGVGTTSPTYTIHAAGSQYPFRAQGTDGNAIILNPSYNYYDAYNHIFRSLNGTTTYATIFNTGGIGINTTTDAGYKLDVNGTMRVSGAATFSSSVTINGSASQIRSGNELRFYRTDNGIYTQLYDGGSGVGFVLDNRNGDGFNFQSAGTSQMRLNPSGAATFSSSVTAAQLNINSSGTEIVNIQNVDNSARQSLRIYHGINSSGGIVLFNSASSTGTETGGLLRIHQQSSSLTQPSAVFRQDGSGDILQLQGSAGASRLTIASTGAATFSSSIEAATAIAIGTTPDTNKPFKVLKNINGTVGINFENTSTGSLAFSAIQMGTDVSGGTAFANLVYSSSGVTAAGVYQPSGTSLINTGSGGLNFLSVSQPIRFFTSTGNGTERLRITNDGDITHYNGTSPSASTTDAYRMYSADVVAGNAAPHFRTENGAVIKLYQETTGVGNAIFSQGGGNSVLDDSTFDGYTLRQIVKALRNQGILA